jgi:hypothetical protein
MGVIHDGNDMARRKHSPAGLVIVSGDVHHADLLGNPPIEVCLYLMLAPISSYEHGW